MSLKILGAILMVLGTICFIAGIYRVDFERQVARLKNFQTDIVHPGPVDPVPLYLVFEGRTWVDTSGMWPKKMRWVGEQSTVWTDRDANGVIQDWNKTRRGSGHWELEAM